MTPAARTPSLRARAARHRRAIEARTGIDLRPDNVIVQEIIDAPRTASAWPSPDRAPDTRSDAEVMADLRAFEISDEARRDAAKNKAKKGRLRRLAWRRARREAAALRKPKAKAPAKQRAKAAPAPAPSTAKPSPFWLRALSRRDR